MHECDECGGNFNTLTKLRLHDCEDDESHGGFDEEQGGFWNTRRDEPDISIEALDESLEKLREGENDEIFTTVSIFSKSLDKASQDTYSEISRKYEEPLTNELHRVRVEEGWGVLSEFIDAYYPPESDDEIVPYGSIVIENAVGRYIIETRLTEGVEEIQPKALEYLYDVTVRVGENVHAVLEESHAYGWGIGHPEHSVIDNLMEIAAEREFWISAVLENAFYADQHAAVELLETLMTQEKPDVSSPYTHDSRHILDSVVGPDSNEYWPTTPRYWDWHEEFDYTFEWDPEVKEKIEEIVHEMGFDQTLPEDWEFQDLEV